MALASVLTQLTQKHIKSAVTTLINLLPCFTKITMGEVEWYVNSLTTRSVLPNILKSLNLRFLSGWSIIALMWLLTPPKITPTPTSSEDSREISAHATTV